MSVASLYHSIRRGWGKGLALLSCLGGIPVSAQILDWEAALGEIGGGQSTFTSVVAHPGDPGAQPPTAIAAGFFDGNFQIGGLTLNNPADDDGVVARFVFDVVGGTGWNPLWFAQITTPTTSLMGASRIHDLTVDENGRFLVTGTFNDDIEFGGPGITLSSTGMPSGFVAWGDADLGTWQGAYATPGLLPESIAVGEGPTPDTYLTGDGALARAYTNTGTVIWNEPTPAGINALTDIALFAAPGVPDVYVLGEDAVAGNVVLFQLDRGSGGQNWQRGMGAPGPDFAGGLAVPVDGDPRVAFMVQDPNPDYNGTPLPPLPANGITQALMLRIDVGGNLVWSAPVGQAQDPASEMKVTDLAVDEFGNAFVAAAFNGGFLIESPPIQGGNNDAAILGVDAAGLLFDFHRSNGAAIESPTAVAAPVRDLLVTVGHYGDSPSAFGSLGLPPLTAVDQRAFFAVATPEAVGGQGRFVVRPVPPTTIQEAIDIINQNRGQIYSIITFSTGALSVAAFLDDDAQTALDVDPLYFLEPDYEIRPSGTNGDAGWALEHLNDAANTSTVPFSFGYPEPAQRVNVYLLDTAIDNSSGFFTPNTNLTLEATTLVRGTGDPLVSSLFQHGTEMLSLIGGPATGAAIGIPITLKNYDFYPTGAPTTASLLAQAVYDAIDYQEDFGECRPGIIILASTSAATGSSLTISDAVDEAIAAGIPVVVSAGNSSALAADYTPASKGSVDGVLCVGASTDVRAMATLSNSGTAVDFYAPGKSVRVVKYSDPLGGSYVSFNGTSASAALAGAAAINYLSINPWSSPADLETAMVGDLDTGGAVDIVQLSSSGPAFYLDYDDWTTFFGLATVAHTGDDDGDGWTNLEEFFYGLLPCESDPKGTQTALSYDTALSETTFTFRVSTVLLDTGSLGTLLDGTTYEVTDDTTLTSFTATGETLSVGSSTDGQTELSQTASATDPACFFRVEITSASPSP